MMKRPLSDIIIMIIIAMVATLFGYYGIDL